MSMKTYDIGDRVRLTCTFKDQAGVAVDPTTVTCSVRSPAGTITTPAVTKDSVGNYRADVDPTLGGVWEYRFVGTGAALAAAEGSFTVRVSRIA